ncbi:jg25129 [Pararge aegeria aegeria]|uniref:Jg25129 protein n=1 Tax=Pararge aegeria aegeria TaxID=348720 RepID=A0A8S4SBT8_9NEOP|nr:jg25129 [Pararge aegeria aegeria]
MREYKTRKGVPNSSQAYKKRRCKSLRDSFWDIHNIGLGALPGVGGSGEMRAERPYFDDVSPRNVSSVVGQSAVLRCRAKHIGNRTKMTMTQYEKGLGLSSPRWLSADWTTRNLTHEAIMDGLQTSANAANLQVNKFVMAPAP